MAAVWQGNVIDLQGNIIPAALVTVRDQVGGGLTPLFEDFACTSPLTNPVISDQHGFVRFFVQNNGLYQITAKKGGFTREWTYVLLIGQPTGGYVPREVVEPDPLAAGNNNDWNAEFSTAEDIGRVHVTPDASGTSVITGMNGGAANVDGRRIILTNFTSDPFQISAENVLSLAVNRFAMNGDLFVPAGASHEFIYDALILTGRWSKLGN